MHKNLPSLIAALQLILITHVVAITAVVQNIDADDVPWTLTGFSDSSYIGDGVRGDIERYDERSLTITGGGGTVIDSVRVILDASGSFDDSLAIDFDSDGVIDYLATQSAAYATPGIGSGEGNYQPWVDASPFTLDATITATGTTVRAYWNGVEILLTGNSVDDFSGGFNDAGNFTLQDWGLNGSGEIPSNSFISTSIRLGSMNDTGPSSHDLSFSIDAVAITDDANTVFTFDPDGDGLPANIPEPSTSMLLVLVFGGAFFVRVRL